MIGIVTPRPSSSRCTWSGSGRPPLSTMPEICGKFADTCAVSTPSTISGRSPGVTTSAPSKSRSSTFGSVIAATTRPGTSRASRDSSPLTRVPSQAGHQVADRGRARAAAPRGWRTPARRRRDNASGALSGPAVTRLAMTANRVPWWAASSAVARSAAVRSSSRPRPLPLSTSSTGAPRLAAIRALKANSVGRADVGVVAADDHDGVALLGDPVVAVDDPVHRRVGVGVHVVVGDAGALVVGQLDGLVGDQQVEHVVALDRRGPSGRPAGRRRPARRVGTARRAGRGPPRTCR